MDLWLNVTGEVTFPPKAFGVHATRNTLHVSLFGFRISFGFRTSGFGFLW